MISCGNNAAAPSIYTGIYVRCKWGTEYTIKSPNYIQRRRYLVNKLSSFTSARTTDRFQFITVLKTKWNKRVSANLLEYLYLLVETPSEFTHFFVIFTSFPRTVIKKPPNVTPQKNLHLDRMDNLNSRQHYTYLKNGSLISAEKYVWTLNIHGIDYYME